MKKLILTIGAVIALAVASAGVVVAVSLGSATPAYADGSDNGGGGH